MFTKLSLPATYSSELHNNRSAIESALVVPNGASVVPLTENRLLTPKEYDRDTRHYEFDTQGMATKWAIPWACIRTSTARK